MAALLAKLVTMSATVRRMATEDHFAATTEKRRQHVDKEGWNTSFFIRQGVGTINSGSDHEEDAPVELAISNFLEVEEWLAIDMHDQEEHDPEHSNAERPDEVDGLADGEIWEEAWHEHHDQEAWHHEQIDLLWQGHRRQRHLLFNHFWVDGFELGHINTQHKFHNGDIDSHDEHSHHDVDDHVLQHWDGHWVAHGGSHALERCVRNELRAHEWEQRLRQRSNGEHTDEEIAPDLVVSGDAHRIHEGDADWQRMISAVIGWQTALMAKTQR